MSRRLGVVQHEVLVVALVERLDELLVGGATERRVDDRLGLAPREEPRPVRPRRNAHLAGDRTDVRGSATVDALSLRDDHAAHEAGADVVQDVLHSARDRAQLALTRLDGLEAVERHLLLPEVTRETLEHLRLDRIDGGVALGLRGDAHRFREPRFGGLAHPPLEIRVPRVSCRDLELGLADATVQILLRLEQLDDLLVRELERIEHLALGHVLRTALDHHESGAAAGHDEIQLALG
jgi:hypothetical protein